LELTELADDIRIVGCVDILSAEILNKSVNDGIGQVAIEVRTTLVRV
jgi:hypothetical protein